MSRSENGRDADGTSVGNFTRALGSKLSRVTTTTWSLGDWVDEIFQSPVLCASVPVGS